MKKTTSFMKFLVAGSLIAGMMLTNTAQAGNPPPRIKADAPNRYTVKKGDTLWDISARYLKNPSRWKEIWATNKQIKNPNLIYPKDILIMCIIQGKTLVGVDTGKGCAGIREQVTQSKKVKPRMKRVRPVGDSIPTIPLQAIRYWLDKVAIVNPLDLQDTPYVFASKNRNLLTAKGDTIYVKGALLQVGQTYGVYRKGEPFIDPMSKVVTGVEVTQVAKGIVKDVSANGVSTIQLTESYGKEVNEGDRVFADMGVALPPAFGLQPARVKRAGRIVRITNAIGVAAGAGNVVAINIGSLGGARIGDVFTVYRKGPLVRDTFDNDMPVRLPSEPAGRIMVFRTFNHISYAYVLNSEGALSVGDQLLSPLARN